LPSDSWEAKVLERMSKKPKVDIFEQAMKEAYIDNGERPRRRRMYKNEKDRT